MIDKLHQHMNSNFAAYKRGDYQKSEDGWLALIPQFEKAPGKGNQGITICLYALAMIYKDTERYDKAEQCLQRLLAIVGSQHQDFGAHLNLLNLVYKAITHKIKSGNYLYQPLVITDEELPSDHIDFIITLDNLAKEYIAKGYYSEAENCFKRSLSITEKTHGSDHLETAICLNNLANVYQVTGRYAEAENCHQRSLDVKELHNGPTHQSITSSLNNLAIIYQDTGRYAKAEKCLQRSLLLTDTNHKNTVYILNNLGSLYEETGRYDEAEYYYQRSLAIIDNAADSTNPDLANSLLGLAGVYAGKKLYTESERYLQQSLLLHDPDNPETAKCLHNLAEIYRNTGRYVEAANHYQQSLEIKQLKLGLNHPSTANTMQSLAIVYKTAGRYPEANKYYQQSLAIMERTLGQNHPATATILHNIAILFQITGRLNAAILLGKRSVNILQTVRQNVSDIGNGAIFSFDKTLAPYYDNLAKTLIDAGRYGEAEYVMGMLKEKDFFELLRRDRRSGLEIRTITYNDAEAPLVKRFDELGSSLFSLGRQEETLKQIKDHTYENNQNLAAVREQLKKVNWELSEFLNNLNETLPQMEVSQIDQDSYKLINMTDADVNTVAIFTATAEDSFHTVLVTPYGRKAFSADHKAADIATMVLKFRELLKDPDDPAHFALSQELYNIIIRPIEKELLVGGYTTILWMLNGVLRLLPLAALHDGKQFVLEKLQNVCITTCSVIGQQSHEHWNGLGMGVTLKHGDHSPLPAVKDELEGIISKDNSTGVMRGDILLDEAFTRDAMESHLADGYKAVHIASHFELNPANETMSYLLLGDGSRMQMDELRSNPRLFNGVDLVAFSACSTGLGTASTRGREVDGIGYLGEMQGAKTVLATLWPVEDKSTSMLMREFYRLREEGMTKAEALQQAQLCLLNGKFQSEDGHDFTHPYFWAPFILIGNGG